MTSPTTPRPPAPTPEVSINDNLPTSSPGAKSTLIGLACVLSIVVLVALYSSIIGF
jgi:hypothetical protein